MIALLLAACGGAPPDNVRCDHIPAGLVGEIIESDGSTRPAFRCEGYWRCDEVSWFEGVVYDVHEDLVEVAPGVWETEQTIEDSDLWCDRCEWAGESAMILELGAWAELALECPWVTP